MLVPRNTYIKAPCARDVYIKSVFIGVVCNSNACIKVTCARSASAVKHLGLYLQSFQILEVKLFRTGLGTKVKVG